MIKFEDIDLREHIFTWVFNDDTTYHFAVDRLRRWLRDPANKAQEHMALVPVTAGHVSALRLKGTVDKPHVDALVKDWRAREPLIVALVPYQDMAPMAIIIDGNHTFVAAHELGLKEAPAYVLPEKVWEKFVIDMPPNWSQVGREIVAEGNKTAKL